MLHKALLLGLVLVVCPGLAASDDVAELKATFEGAVAALNDGNLDGFLATVHDKALSFYSCGPTSGKEGKEACQLDWQRFFGKTRTAKFEPQNMQYRVIGDTGIAWGEYAVVVQGRDGKEHRHQGRYTMTYTKVGGKWKIVMQHNTPAAEAPGVIAAPSGS